MHNLLSLKIIPSKREAQVTAVAIKMIITTSKKTAHKCSQRRKNKLKPYRHMRHNKWLKVFECVRVCVFVHGKEIESERKKIMLEHYVQFKTIVVMVICFFFCIYSDCCCCSFCFFSNLQFIVKIYNVWVFWQFCTCCCRWCCCCCMHSYVASATTIAVYFLNTSIGFNGNQNLNLNQKRNTHKKQCTILMPLSWFGSWENLGVKIAQFALFALPLSIALYLNFYSNK